MRAPPLLVPQGKLLALDLSNGNIGWEATVATPKGASELERLVDVVGRPVVDAERVCASAYRGRVACFDLIRGTVALVARRQHADRSAD